MKLQIAARLTFFILLIAISTMANAQKFDAEYTYDANGNRIKATVVYLTQGVIKPRSAPVIDIDKENELSLQVYPNPTKGVVLLELVNATEEQLTNLNNCIRVWDIQGRIIIEIKSVSEQSHIDLSGYPSGTYIVLLNFAGKQNYLKVIKN